MAIVQATMISGRYRTQSLMRHWSTNVKGNCLLTSECDGLVEDLPHFIQLCPGLRSVRDGLIEYTMNMCSNLPPSTSSPNFEIVTSRSSEVLPLHPRLLYATRSHPVSSVEWKFFDRLTL